MWRVIQWLISYILGGLSFTLLLIAGLGLYIWTFASTPIGDSDPGKAYKGRTEHDALQEEAETGHPKDMDAVLDGWLTIRRTYDRLEGGLNPLLTPPPVTEEPVVDSKGQQRTTYSSRIAQTYRSITGASKKTDAPKDYFWCALKGSVFYVHKLKEERTQDWEEIKKRFPNRDEDSKRPSREMLETVVVLDMNRYQVTVEDKDGPDGIIEGKLFSKRNAVVLRLIDLEKGKKEGLPVLAKGMSSDAGETFVDEGGPWYIFSKSNCKAEDWYLSLLRYSRARPSTSQVWSKEHMSWFKEKMHSDDEEDKSGLEWLNAIVGRIFLGITHTALVEQFIMDKLNKKLALVSHPLIGPLVATEVNLGHIPPTFSNAMLKQCDANGEVRFNAHIDYRQPKHIDGSGIRITIEATKLGFRAVLAVVVKAISGDVEVRIKGPPSDRIWWAFLNPPKMDISIEPVLGSRTINWSVVLSFIEKKMREGINDSVVLPYMDDTPFFNTEGMSPRGGIFNSASKTAYAKEKEQKDDSDSKSVVSTDSPADKEKGDQIPTRKDKPFDAQSVASAKTHTEGMGLRKRGNKVSQSEENLLETHAVQRAETTPDLLSAKKPSSLRMFASRPTSPRKDIGSITEQSPSLDESSSLNSSTELPKQVHTTSVSIDENKSPERPASVASFDSDGQPTNKLTPQSVLTAVRSRDKTALQSQVSVGREAVKKWGVDFMNKRREHRQEREQRIAQQQEQSSPPSYYAPSAEDDLSSSQPRSSFQERLNAAALAAAAKLESERKAAAANQGTPPQLPNRPSPPQLPNRPTPPQLPSRNTKPRSDSSGSSTLSPARPMVVPSVPKRPGIPTAIGNDASKAKSELAVPALSGGASGGGEEIESLAPPPQITRGDSDPLAATVNDRVDDIGETDKAAAPVPSVTAANVTARTRQASNGSNSSPARESLLAAAAQSPPIVPGSEKQ